MAEVKLSNLPSMDVNGLIEQLSKQYVLLGNQCRGSHKDFAFSNVPPALVKARL